MRRFGYKGQVALALIWLSAIVAWGQGSVALEQSASGVLTTQATTVMSQYRTLAESAYKEFQQGDYAGAARTCGLLDMAWDQGTAALKTASPDAWHATDTAMDKFIGPIKRSVDKPADAADVRAAHDDFMQRLDAVDGPLIPDQSLDVLKTPSGVVCIRVRRGSGRQPKLGDIVVLRATGLLENGNEFRSPPQDGSPGWYWLLPGRQPAGLIEAMSVLHVGDSAVIVLPASLGYGPMGGRDGAVPPDAPLTYVVDLLDVKSREIADVLTKTIESKGVDAAVEQYHVLERQGFPDVYVNMDQLNYLGYDLLNKSKDNEAAIKIFQLNVQTFPNSANVYDSLGEAYAKNGQREDAIANYRKALSIDPKMESPANALKELESK